MKRLLLLCLLVVSLSLLPVLGGAQQPPRLLPDLGHPLLKNLQAWWRAWPGFTGGALWYDLVGRQHATLNSMGFSATSGWTVSDRRGGSWVVAFDGTDDSTTAADTPGLRMDLNTPFTWAFWAKTTYVGGTALTYVSKRQGDFTGFQVVIVGSKVGCQFYQNSSAQTMGRTATPTSSDGAWHHVACTYDGSATDTGFLMYLDGSAVTTTAAGVASLAGSAASTGALWFLASPFAASMDDVRFWRRTLTAQEMQAVYQQSLLGDPDLFPPLAPLGMPVAGGTPGGFLPFFR